MASTRRRRGLRIEAVNALEFLEGLDVRNIHEGESELNFSCPFDGHTHGDENPSAYMNRESTAWNCKGCKRKGNAITFLADLYGVSHRQAVDWLRETWGGAFQDTESMAEEVESWLKRRDDDETERRPQMILPDEVAEQFSVPWEDIYTEWEEDEATPGEAYMFDRGFQWETLEEFGFGYDPWSDRIVFPIRNVSSQIVGFKGRTYDGREPKYLVIGDRPKRAERYGFSTYRVELVVPFLDRAVSSPDYNGHLIIREGEWNAIKLHELGYANTVSTGSANFSDEQAKLIKRYADSVTWYGDYDKSGVEAMVQCVDKLAGSMPVLVTPEQEGDPVSHPHEVEECLKSAQSALAVRLGLML